MSRTAQRGVAVVTAILVVAVAASAATWMLAQQSATLNQTALSASRAQADLFAQAGLDWARGILAEDARAERRGHAGGSLGTAARGAARRARGGGRRDRRRPVALQPEQRGGQRPAQRRAT